MNFTKIKTFHHLYIPANKKTTKTMVILHGRGDSYYGFQDFVGELNYPDINYLLINAPDEYFFGYSWYDLFPNQLPGIIRSRELLDQLFNEFDQMKIPSQDVLMFGFSQGCLMCLEWGGRTKRNLAGFIGVSGYCYDPIMLGKELSDNAKKSSWLITHGKEDDVLPYYETEKDIGYLIKAGLPIDFHSYHKGHTIDPTKEFALIRKRIIQIFQ